MCANKCRNADGLLNRREFYFSTPHPHPKPHTKKKRKKKEEEATIALFICLIDVEDVHGHYGHT